MTTAESTGVRHYLCVFYGDRRIVDDVVDLGNDPDFSPPSPTWGICRPHVRSRWVKPGSTVVFVGFYAPDTYLFKGWMTVSQIISYPEALARFPTRQNVIIRRSDRSQPAAAKPNWYDRRARDAVEKRCGSREPPAFLREIHTPDGVLIQNPDDEHEVDNWKCRRMFLDNRKQLMKCIAAWQCLREAEFGSLSGYVVGGEPWFDAGRRRIPWLAVQPPRLKGSRLRTPLGQHNAMILEQADIEAIRGRC